MGTRASLCGQSSFQWILFHLNCDDHDNDNADYDYDYDYDYHGDQIDWDDHGNNGGHIFR